MITESRQERRCWLSAGYFKTGYFSTSMNLWRIRNMLDTVSNLQILPGTERTAPNPCRRGHVLYSTCPAPAIHQRPEWSQGLAWLYSTTPHIASLQITETLVSDSNPVFKIQLNLNTSVWLCFVALLSYLMMHLGLEGLFCSLLFPPIAWCTQVAGACVPWVRLINYET